MQQQTVFNYSFSLNTVNREKKEKIDRKPQRRKKIINYIDTIYTPKVSEEKSVC